MSPRTFGRTVRLATQPVVAAVGIGSLMALVALRDETPLPTPAPLPSLSVAIQIGSSGEEHDEHGSFWWLESPSAAIRVFNNLDRDVDARLTFDLMAPWCRHIQVADVSPAGGEPVRHTLSNTSSTPIEVGTWRLGAHEAMIVRVSVAGEPCGPTPTDPRHFYALVRDLTAEVED